MDESFIQQLAFAIGEQVAESTRNSNEDLVKKLEELQKTMVKAGVTSATGQRLRQRVGSKNNQILSQILNQLSVAVPGGARVFGLGRLVKTVRHGTGVITKFNIAIVGAVGGIGALTEAFYQISQQLGGISLDRAITATIGTLVASVSALFRGELINPFRSIQIRGAFAREFGGLISATDAKELQLVTQRLGLGVQELITLERTLQSTGMNVEETINQFGKIGITAKVAATELNKNAAAVARSGENFNSYIVESISNAKRLGLEFTKMEKTLTGFSTDFEGTVSSFASLRALVPGFSVDFRELFTTALYGSTDEYIDLVRRGLLNAGVDTTTGLGRHVGAALQGLGFTMDEVNRILQNRSIDFETELDLDESRNNILSSILGVTLGILTAIGMSGSFTRLRMLRSHRLPPGVQGPQPNPLPMWGARAGTLGMGLGGLLASGMGAKLARDAGHETTAKIISMLGGGISGGLTGLALSGGNVVGGVLGALAGGVGGAFMNDFVFRPGQPPVSFNPSDTLVGVKDTSDIGMDTSRLENKVDQLVMTMNEQLSLFKGGLFVEMRDMDKAIIRQQESTIRNY